jgi:hypothetical protein
MEHARQCGSAILRVLREPFAVGFAPAFSKNLVLQYLVEGQLPPLNGDFSFTEKANLRSNGLFLRRFFVVSLRRRNNFTYH